MSEKALFYRNTHLVSLIDITILIILSGVPITATAQEESNITFYGGGIGPAIPFNEGYQKIGFQAGALIKYVITPKAAVSAGADYYRLGFEKGEVVPGVSQFQTIKVLSGNVRYFGSGEEGYTPYALGGLGLYFISRTTRVVGGTVTPFGGDRIVGELEGLAITKLGVQVGAGVEKALGDILNIETGFSLFGEGKFHIVLTKGETLKLATFSVGIQFKP